MTAPVPGGTRDQLAEALAGIYAGQLRYDVPTGQPMPLDHPQWTDDANALLPLVERIATERAAKALRDAADDLLADAAWAAIHDRAAALQRDIP